MSTLGEDIDRLALLTKREQILLRRAAEAKKKRILFEQDVYDRMVGEGWQPNKSSVNRNGFKFRPSSTTYAVIQDEGRLVEWLRQQEGDDFDYAGIVENTLKKGELNRLVRSKQDNREQLPPGLGSYEKTMINKSGILGKQDDEQENENDES